MAAVDPKGAAVIRRRALLIGVLAAALCAISPTPITGQRATFRARTDVVRVNVSVMKGREPMAGLTAADFALTDNGVLQQVDDVSSDQVPIDITLALTGYAVERSADHITGLISAEATRKLLRPADRLRGVRINHVIEGGLVDTTREIPTDHTDSRQIPGIALVDGLFYALAWPVDPDRRHLVAVLTDGMDDWSTLEQDMLPKLAERSDAVMHAVLWSTPDSAPKSLESQLPGTGPTGWQPPSIQTREWMDSYRRVTAAVERTGGTLQTAKKGADALAAIIDDFRHSYVLSFTPKNVPLTGWHELKVKVTRPGSHKVRARRGYEAGRQE